MLRRTILLSVLLFFTSQVFSQVTKNFNIVDYSNPKKYEIADIQVDGIKYLDADILIGLTGLSIGETIDVPGSEITHALEKLWDQGLFSDVKISILKTEGDKISLLIFLQEQARLASVSMSGIKKGQIDDIKEKINLRPGNQVTDNIVENSANIIKEHFNEKGYFNTEVEVIKTTDTIQNNAVNLTFNIKKNDRIKIKDIVFEGNEAFSEAKLRRKMKNTKKINLNIFKASKYIRENLEEDFQTVVSEYNEEGYRDARVVSDSMWFVEDNRLMVKIKVYEGQKYFFRDVKWVGNTKYPSEYLNAVLNIKKGDHYDKTLLNERLFSDEDAVSAVYMDNGYLFFNLNPVEVRVDSDSIDLEMRISEGDQATIDRIIISGNERVHDYVIRREIWTRPGELFSRSEIIRTQRELAQLGYFDPEQMGVEPLPKPEDGKVDIKYTLVEKANDQLEIAGGWGGVGQEGKGMLVGTIGIRFSNFAIGRTFDKGAWRPVPTGDGQTLSIRAQSNGSFYKTFSLSFVEPWLGRKKPNSLSVSAYHTVQNLNVYNLLQSSDQYFKVTGVSLGLGRRLKVPDNYFTLYNALSMQRFDLNNYGRGFLFTSGISHNLSFSTVFGRNSVDQPIYPRSGSDFSLTVKFTPPYSSLNGKDYTDQSMTDQEKYKWVEYHKWQFKSAYYQRIVENLVLSARAEFGYLGYYNKDLGYSPFEGFVLGGDGLAGYNLYGNEYIGQRGYKNQTLTPKLINDSGASYDAGRVYEKVTLELRYPLSLNPQATIYALAFLEGGNAWTGFDDFNAFEIKRSAGVGVRLFLPMLGMLGVDWGYGFDDNNQSPGEISGAQFHFIIGQQF